MLSAGVGVDHLASKLPAVLEGLAMLAALVFGGRYLLRPLLRIVAKTKVSEAFTAAALLVVVGTSLLVSAVGLSMALGAFVAGLLLADSEYRHELEADIEPFKGLLLGLFFISVGMSSNLGLVLAHPLAIFGATLGLMAVKGAILLGLGRMSGHSWDSSRGLAVALCQGGEFAFVLFGLAADNGILGPTLTGSLIIVVTLSMALTPLAFVLNDVFIARWLKKRHEEHFDEIDAGENKIIIAGFGRVGQIVARLLRARKIAFTALDKSAEQIDTVRRFGSRAYYGDASRLDMLRAAKADKAEILVLAIDDIEASVRTVATVRKHFPNLRIYARARNRFHAYRLLDLGVDYLMRETYLSSLEIGRQVLLGLGLAEWEAHDTVARFQEHDERAMQRQHAVYHDETQLIQSSKEAARELEEIFESDTESNRHNPSSAPTRPVFSPSDVR